MECSWASAQLLYNDHFRISKAYFISRKQRLSHANPCSFCSQSVFTSFMPSVHRIDIICFGFFGTLRWYYDQCRGLLGSAVRPHVTIYGGHWLKQKLSRLSCLLPDITWRPTTAAVCDTAWALWNNRKNSPEHRRKMKGKCNYKF